jgi:cutinase
MHQVIPLLPPEVKNQIAGGVLWGDTKNKQTNGQIEGLPKEKLMILCTPDDGVCWGSLGVTVGHIAYVNNGDQEISARWFKQKIDAALKAKAGKGKMRRSFVS